MEPCIFKSITICPIGAPPPMRESNALQKLMIGIPMSRLSNMSYSNETKG